MPGLLAPVKEKSRGGRPAVLTEQERTRRIRQAAEQVFFSVGYGAATMEEIAVCAGMSKRTLYAFYPDKASLLRAVVDDVEAFPVSTAPQATDWPGLVAELRQRMLDIGRLALSDRQLRLTRLVIAEAVNQPALTELFLSRVIARATVHVSDGIRALRHVVPTFDAKKLEQLGMTAYFAAMGNLHLMGLFGRRDNAEIKRLPKRIDEALAMVGIVAHRQPDSASIAR